MATLTGQSIALSYEQLLHVDTDGGGNTTTLVPIKDGDNGTTFAAQLSTTTICIDNPTTSSSSQGGILRLQSDDGAALGDTHRLGVIEFGAAEDGSNTITTGARIEAIADAAWSASENGADMVFYTTDGNASQSEVMRLTADNLVGIGTAAPQCQLHLDGNAAESALLLIEDTSDNFLTLGTWSSNQAVIGYGDDDDNGTHLNFYSCTGEPFSGTALTMSLTDDNRVGIGIASPQTLFHVSNATAATIAFSDSGAGTDEKHFYIRTEGGVTAFSSLDDSYGYEKQNMMAFDHSAGDVTFTGDLIMAAGKGIDFSSAADTGTGETVTSSILDDYEEGYGNFILKEGSNVIDTGSDNVLVYVRVGKMVYIGGYIIVAADASVGTGAVTIAGLPFVMDNATSAGRNWGNFQVVEQGATGFSTTGNYVFGGTNYGISNMFLMQSVFDGTSVAQVVGSELAQSMQMRVSGTYMAA